MLGTCSSTNTYMHWEFPTTGKGLGALDSEWPNTTDRDIGKKFYLYLLRRNGKWIWRCRECQFFVIRTVRCNGRYLCRRCMSVLIDVNNHQGSNEAQDFRGLSNMKTRNLI